MAPEDASERLADLISAPLEELIVALGSGIGRSQAELDRHSMETQRRIDEDPVLSQYGLRASWYQIPRTELELKVNVVMEGREQRGEHAGVSPAPPPGAAAAEFVAGRVLAPLPRAHIEPVNARYQNTFGYDVQAASTMRLEVVPVPPPGQVAAAAPRLSAVEVLDIADSAHMIDRPSDRALYLERGTGWRRSVNFNAALQQWFVVQSQEEEDKVRLRALVKVDDETGEVLKTLRRR